MSEVPLYHVPAGQNVVPCTKMQADDTFPVSHEVPRNPQPQILYLTGVPLSQEQAPPLGLS